MSIEIVESLGLGLTSALFTGAAIVVWVAGWHLSRYADAIAERTGLGRAFVGVLFLGAVTSLPEMATTASAAGRGYPTLAGTNLLGGVAMQIAVLALIDGIALPKRALTRFSGDPIFMMQAALLALLLAVTIAAIAIGNRLLIAHVDVWSILIAAAYCLALYVIYRYEGIPGWQPIGEITAAAIEDAGESETGTTGKLYLMFALASAVVLVSGYLVAVTGARLAEITGLGETFVGATMVAAATSLPEVSTTFAAVRIGALSMAVGNIFGTNALELALFLPADLLYEEGSIFAALDERAVFIGALSIALTCVYLWGVLERHDRTVASFGIDSALVLLLYLAGTGVLFLLT